MGEQGHKNPPPSLPPLQIYFLKFLIFSCLFDWTKFSFVCFLKILLKIMFHCLVSATLSNALEWIFILNYLPTTRVLWYVYVHFCVCILVSCMFIHIYNIYIYIYIYIHIMFAMHCGVYDVIMTRECSLNEVTFCNFDFFLMF